MVDIRFDLTVPDWVQNVLTQRDAQPAVARAVMKTAVEARDILAAATPVDTGDTARRWQVTKRPRGADLTAVVSNDSGVATFLEYGFPPGRWVPKGVLIPWMLRHGIPASSEFMVRRAIFLRGRRPAFIVRGNLALIQQKLEDNIVRELNARV